MTVAELIERLQELPQSLIVIVNDNEDGCGEPVPTIKKNTYHNEYYRADGKKFVRMPLPAHVPFVEL